MRFWPSSGEIRLGPPPLKAPASVTLEILETIALNQLSTKASVTAWLLVEYDADEVRTEVDRLVREGYLLLVRSEGGPQGTPSILTLSALGEEELKRLQKDGADTNSL